MREISAGTGRRGCGMPKTVAGIKRMSFCNTVSIRITRPGASSLSKTMNILAKASTLLGTAEYQIITRKIQKSCPILMSVL